ncbi:MAG: hypothetical protein RR192_04210 [Peptostreptococcaceae bacterium]
MFRKKITFPFIRQIDSSPFWKTCEFCQIEFKKEKYYSITRKNKSGVTFTEYACNQCFSCVSDLKAKLDSNRCFRPIPFYKKNKSKDAINTSTLHMSEHD